MRTRQVRAGATELPVMNGPAPGGMGFLATRGGAGGVSPVIETERKIRAAIRNLG